MIDGAVYRDGKVAIRLDQPIPKYVQVNRHEYVASVQHGVSVLFADEADVSALLNVIGGCCGGQKKIFSLCSEHALKVFDTGER